MPTPFYYLKKNISLLIVLFSFPAQLQSETYVTEKTVQIDRCACAWYIMRQLDADPQFLFFSSPQKPPKGISYDFFGAEYFHKGADCSYTTMIKRHMKRKDPALIKINIIVNDVNAWQNTKNSLTNDIKRLIDSYHDHGIEDTDIYQRTALIFDALYRSYGGETKFAYPAQAKSQLATLPTNTGEHSEALKNQEQALMTRIDSLKGK